MFFFAKKEIPTCPKDKMSRSIHQPLIFLSILRFIFSNFRFLFWKFDSRFSESYSAEYSLNKHQQQRAASMENAHTHTAEELFRFFGTGPDGLGEDQVEDLRDTYGYNGKNFRVLIANAKLWVFLHWSTLGLLHC